MTSIIRLFMQNKCLYIILSFYDKKNRHSSGLSNSSKAFLNQWESMDFHKLILDFCKSCNEIGQKHFGPYIKNKVFWAEGLNENCKNFYFKISPKKSDGRIFLKKTQENPNFGPLCRNVNLPLKLNCISFCRFKNS